MREDSPGAPQLPLVFDNHGTAPIRSSQFAPADVVEPPVAPGAGLHPQLASRDPRHLPGVGRDCDHDGRAEHDLDATRVEWSSPLDDAQGRAHPTLDEFVDELVDDPHHDHDHDHDHDSDDHADDHSPCDVACHARRDGDVHHPDEGHDDEDRDDFGLALISRLDREQRRRERRRRQRRWTPDTDDAGGTDSLAWSGPVDPRRRPPRGDHLVVRRALRHRLSRRADHRPPKLPSGHQRHHRSAHGVDPQSRSVRSFATGPLEGVALALYFVLLPYVLETKWRSSYSTTDGVVMRDLLVGLGIFWIVFLALLIAYVHQLRHRRTLPGNGCAWLASLVIAALPFLVTSSADAAPSAHLGSRAVAATRVTDARPLPPAHEPVPSLPAASHVALFAAALTAKGRRDRLRRARDFDDDDLDALARRLRDTDDRMIAQLRDVIGSARDGQSVVDDDATQVEGRVDFDPVVVSVLERREGALELGYAREGGSLPVDLSWSAAELSSRVIALHDGSVTFAHGDNELMRALARRRDLSNMVVYLGDPNDLDEELRGLCVTLRAARGTSGAREPYAPHVRVELLRAYPQVQGLHEDFTATLRRRSIEMVAYLAMHAGEPVTGDRLRTRVLSHANVDASKTTLNNTASSVRRGLGGDAAGPFLEPVSSGLYRVRDVALDVADFHRLVARGRASQGEGAVALYVEALRLVHGEPLASVLKGFEWFTFEGHRAQLQRDGEWVALALHDAALAAEDVETAFWALRQGLLLDPDSDVLLDALGRVPRLRQFRGDGAGAAQHQSVGPGRAVAMSWAFERFGR